MKARDLYSYVKTIMFEKPSSTIYDNYFIGNCNRVIAELFNENNMLRVFKGYAPLEEMPLIYEMDDEIEYESEYVYDVMPKGIAAYFLIDDDLQKYGIYATDYNNARVLHQVFVSADKL